MSDQPDQRVMSKRERVTFRKGKHYSGQMRLPNTYHVMRGGEEIAVIQQLGNDDSRWFWYCKGVNTCQNAATLSQCQAEVKDYFANRL